MTFTYKTKGVCSTSITIEVEDDIVKSVQFNGGCDGNAKALAALVAGLPADEIIAKLDSIRCGYRQTSCPDQLAKALQSYKSQEE